MVGMIPDKIKALVPIFAAVPAIQAVYLFGSHATGTATERSDIDLGIILEKGQIEGRTKLELLTELARAGCDKIDLALVDEGDLVLAHEVVKHHKLLFHREGFDHATYCSKITRQYLDFQPTLKLQAQALKNRLHSKES